MALVLFVSNLIRVDLVALLVLGTLAVTGLVTADEAFAGFSNSAVITIWAMFILSEGLARTGIANIIGRQVLRIAGRREFTVLEVDGVPRPAGELNGHLSGTVRIDDAFIPTHGVTVLAGRGIEPADVAQGRRVAVVDEWFVRHVLGGREAIGMRFRDVPEREAQGTPGPWYEIVGVVRDISLRPDRTAEDGVVYRAWAPEGTEALYVAVRVRGDV